jgi:DNA-binding winged helix-turn-helix (wHTH) protein
MSAETAYPLTYREAEVRRVFRRLEGGESCCLVAAAGAGTLNFLRFLQRGDVQRRYLSLERGAYCLVLVDLNALAELSEWAVYELLLHASLAEMGGMPLPASILERTEDFYRQVVLSKDRLLGQRYFERTVQAICQHADLRLVFLVDRLDRIFDRLDSLFFLSLRALRDTFKYRLCFVVTSLADLTRVRENLAEVEDFYLLFSRNVCGLPPYGGEDARSMLESLAERLGARPGEEEAGWLIDVTGGHPRLLKTLFWAYHEGRLHPTQTPPARLLDDPGVWAECSRLWQGLDEDEQETMRGLAAVDAAPRRSEASAAGPPAEAIQLLRLKGLVRPGPDGEDVMFAPLFREFVRRRGLIEKPGVVLDRQTGDVWVEGRRLPGLTRLEFELLDYLAQQGDRICTRGELASHLYPGEYEEIEGHIVDEPRIDTLVARLRAKLEPDRAQPRYLITVRGRGYKLAGLPPAGAVSL